MEDNKNRLYKSAVAHGLITPEVKTPEATPEVEKLKPQASFRFRVKTREEEEKDIQKSTELWEELQAHRAKASEVEKECRSHDESVFRAHEDLRKARVTNNPETAKDAQIRLSNLEAIRFSLKETFSKKTTELKGQLQTLHDPYDRMSQSIVRGMIDLVWRSRKITFIKEVRDIYSSDHTKKSVVFLSNLETVKQIREELQAGVKWHTLSELADRITHFESLIESEAFLEGTEFTTTQEAYRELLNTMPNPNVIRESESVTGGYMTRESLELEDKHYKLQQKINTMNSEKTDGGKWMGK